MSPLVLGEFLVVSVNPLTTDGKYFVQHCENLAFPTEMQLSEKGKKHFLNFLFYLWNRNQILNILKKKMFVIANVLAKLETVKKLFRTLSKKRCFRTRIDSPHVKVSQIHGKSG